MNENDLRDCFAMFATLGLVSKHTAFDPAEPWRIADSIMEARDQKEEGIVAIKKRVKK